MAKLMFLIVCNVLCVALAQQEIPETTTLPHKNGAKPESNQPHSSVSAPQAQPTSTQEEPAVTQGEPVMNQKQPTVAQKQTESEAKSVAEDVTGRVPLDPKNPQAVSPSTTDKPKGGSALVCANAGLFLVGAAVLLKL